MERTPLVCDVESTISNKGNPFDQRNRLVSVGLREVGGYNHIYYDFTGDFLKDIQEKINRASIIVGFNIKFDLHWLRKIGIDISNIRVWDCQLAEFILYNQKAPYPSLDGTAEKYGFPSKIHSIEENYWSKGIDTDQIPRQELTEYLGQDLYLTDCIFQRQRDLFKGDGRLPLFKLQCADLLVLEEMEWNGILFNTEKAKEKVNEVVRQIDRLKASMDAEVDFVPFNPSSGDHLSAILYGGEILEKQRVPVGEFKTGAKAGQVRYKIMEKRFTLPRLVEPLKNTELKKSTEEKPVWETNEPVMRKLKPTGKAKRFISLLLEYNKLEKLRGTYLEGYAALIEKMGWEHNILHGTFNQCVAITGRLSSSKPNQQNADPITKQFMTTRYKSEDI